MSNYTSLQSYLNLFRKGVFGILLSVLIVCSFNLNGQDLPYGLNRIIPPSPIASELGKYGEIPVGLYTGIPNISVPLWKAKSNKLSLPISLSYHAGGNKVEAISGWVGMGWSLNAGGVITRTVHGLADDGKRGSSKAGYYINPWTSLPLLDNDINSYGPWQPPLASGDSVEDYYLREIAKGHIDTEPDDFYFNFNGYSGKFVINRDGNPVIVPQQKIKIEIDFIDTLASNIETWIITTPDGIKYHFGGNSANEKSASAGTSLANPSDQTPFFSTWYLNKIETPDGIDEINIYYSDYDETVYNYRINHFREDCGDIHPDTLDYYTRNRINRKFISQIITDREIIFFNKSAKFSYNDGDEYRLDEISIRDKYFNQIVKKFQFIYGEFSLETHDPTDDYLSHSRKLKLEKIFEISGDGSEYKPPWVFEYNVTPLPIRSSFAQDHWGFFNGASNDHLIPSLTIENHENYSGPTYMPGTAEYSYEDLTKINTTFQHLIEGIWNNSGADRNPSEDNAKAGILTKITYPTGGFTKFDYEIHDFGYFSTRKPAERIKFYSFGQANYRQFTLTEGQEVKVVVVFYEDGVPVDGDTEVYIQSGSGDKVYSLKFDDLGGSSFTGLETIESIWLYPGYYKIWANPANTSDDILTVLYYEPNSIKNKTYPIYSTIYEEETASAGALIFPDDSADYCSNPFQWSADDDPYLTIDYQFRKPHPKSPRDYNDEFYPPARVRILDPSDQVIFEKIFWDSENDSIEGGGLDDDSYLTGTSSILLDNIGTYTIEFIPRSCILGETCVPGYENESGLIDISFMQAQNDIQTVQAGGLRIKKTTSNDGILNGKITHSGLVGENNIIKEYTYKVEGETDKSSGILLAYPFYYHLVDDLFFDWPYDKIDEGDCFDGYLKAYSSSQAPLGSTQGSHVGYSHVSVKQGNNGSTLNKFSSAIEYPDITDGEFPFAPVMSFDWKRGLPTETLQFDSSGILLSKQLNHYNSVNDTTNRVFIPGLTALQEQPYAYAIYQKYQIMSGWNYLTKTINYTYDSQGSNPIVDSVKYFYENPGHMQLTKTVTSKSNGKDIISKSFYPLDFPMAEVSNSDPAIQAIALMKENLHMHNVVLEQQELIKENQQENLVSGVITKYKEWTTDQILPEKIYQLETNSPLTSFKTWNDSLEFDPNYSLRSEITKYDSDGHLLEYVNENNIPVSYKWGYNNTLPVAKAANSYYDSISGTFPDFQVPDNAQLTVYKHIPLVGISEIIDENGLSTYYNYDNQGRLDYIKDYNQNILNKYAYGYDIEDFESVAASSISPGSSQIIQGDSIALSVQGGELGDGASWKWYTSSCGSSYVGEGSSVTVSPINTTTYYVRAEGNFNTTECVSCEITVLYPEIIVLIATDTIYNGTGSESFGNVTVGEELVRIFRIKNLGSATLNIDNVSENSNHFYIQTQPASQIAAGSYSTFTIAFAPSNVGYHSATLIINNNDIDEDPYTFEINGSGVVPEINLKQGNTTILTGGSFDFGDVDVGSSLSKTFTIENTGTGGLDIASITENSDQFSLGQYANYVAPGSSITFDIVFSPTSSGPKQVTTTINNSDTDENPYSILLDGEGTPTINADYTYTRRLRRVTFTDTSTGNPTSWEWDFNNDGVTDSTVQNPIYVFPGSGSYLVKLTIHKGSESDAIVKTIIIPF